MIATILLLLAIGPEPPVQIEHVDQIETNHYYDELGRHIFTQRIFWTRYGDRQAVLDFRMVKDERNYPTGNKLTWNDSGVIREVRAATKIITHTQHDPECVDRERLPKDCRRELSRVARRERAAEVIREFNAKWSN